MKNLKSYFILCVLFGCIIFLSSCIPKEEWPKEIVIPTSSWLYQTGSIVQMNTGTQAVTLPDYLRQELTGTGLEFVKILDDNASYIRYQISYLSDGLRISGIMNIPKWDAKYPLLILNHGHIDTSIYTLGRGLKREQDYLARQWFAVLHTDYRNHAFSDKDLSTTWEKTLWRSEKYGSDSMNAIIAVREAVKKNVTEVTWVDPERVGMLGHSMGWGVTMYSLVSHPDLIDAAVLYAPVHSNEYYNFEKWTKPRLSKEEYADLEKKYWTLTSSGIFLPISPEWYLSRIDTPVEMYWGTLDDSCPIEWWVHIEEVFSKAGKDIEFIRYDGEAHEFWPRWIDFMEWVSVFFREKL